MTTANERVFNRQGEEVGKRSYSFTEQLHLTTTEEADTVELDITSSTTRLFIWTGHKTDTQELFVTELIGTLTDESSQDSYSYYKLSGSWVTDVMNANTPVIILDGGDRYLGRTVDDVGEVKIRSANGISNSAEVYTYNQAVSDNLYMSIPILALHASSSKPVTVNIYSNTNNSRINIMLAAED